MARKIPIILAFAVLTGSVMAAAAAVGPNVKKDDGFLLDLNADLDPDLYHPRAFFGVCGDTLLVYRFEVGSEEPLMLEYTLGGASAPRGAPDISRTEFPVERPLGTSMQADRTTISYYDPEAAAIVFVEPGGRRYEVPAGRSLIRNFARFANGDMIVVSRTMQAFPFDSYESLAEDGKEITEEMVQALSRKWRAYDLFLTDSELNVLRPLAKKRQVRLESSQRLSDHVRNMISARYVRASADQSKAAVFSRHLPGIDVYSQEGELLGTYEHPGDGREVVDWEPMARVIPSNTRIFYQDDVAIVGDTLFVAETSRQKLWKIDLRTRRAEEMDLEFLVMSMQADSGYLYMVDMAGLLHRYVLED